MTLDEAINHCEEKAKEMYNQEIYIDVFGNERMDDECHKCAREHEQLASWLKELKAYRAAVSFSFQRASGKTGLPFLEEGGDGHE